MYICIGDFPTSLYKCQIWKKVVHLFERFLQASNTDEGCGEEIICLNCVKTNVENSVREKKIYDTKSKLTRLALSYIVSQPSFENINLN